MDKFEYLKALPPAPALSHADRALLLAVFNHTDRHGGGAFPSIATLAAETGIDRRDIRRRLTGLEDRGYLIGEHRNRKPTVWSLADPADMRLWITSN